MYLVAAWMHDVDADAAKGLKYRGVAQVLSSITRSVRGVSRDLGDRRHVLDLESQRARRLQKDEPGVSAGSGASIPAPISGS